MTLGTVKRVVEKRDRKDRSLINTINTSFSGDAFAMTIDQRTCTIENRDSLPYGSQLSAVIATISFDGSLLVYREFDENRQSDDDTGWVAYNSTDSLDLTKTLQLKLTSNDNSSKRLYKLKVNVHSQEGDSLYWNQCESEVDALKNLTDMKAFVLDDKLMALGNNGSNIVLAERSGIDAQGTWNKSDIPTTDLPLTANMQTLCQDAKTNMLYLSASNIIYSSTDAKTWTQVGSYSASLTLIEKTENCFYAISGDKLLYSTDATTWVEGKLDSDATLLPVSDIRALTLQQANGSRRIVIVGQRDGIANSVVWNKSWNDGWKNYDEVGAEWMYFPITPDNKIPCPKLKYPNLLRYDGKCVVFGGASADGSGQHKAFGAMYVSQDYGITWRPSDIHHMPIQLEEANINGCITSVVDKNNYIWIITNAQVWRGRLNRLGFAQQ